MSFFPIKGREDQSKRQVEQRWTMTNFSGKFNHFGEERIPFAFILFHKLIPPLMQLFRGTALFSVCTPKPHKHSLVCGTKEACNSDMRCHAHVVVIREFLEIFGYLFV